MATLVLTISIIITMECVPVRNILVLTLYPCVVRLIISQLRVSDQRKVASVEVTFLTIFTILYKFFRLKGSHLFLRRYNYKIINRFSLIYEQARIKMRNKQ